MTEPKEETANALGQPLGVTLLVLAAFIFVGIPTQLLNVSFGALFSELFIFLAIPFLALKMRGYSPGPSLGVSRARPMDLAWGFALGAANFFGVVAPTQFVMQKVLPESLLKAYDSTQIFKNQTTPELALIVLAVGFAAPLCEEIFFRGFLQRSLSGHRSTMTAIVLTAFIFSAFHLDVVGFLARFELGLLFGLLAVRSGSLWAGIGAHAGNNLVSTGLFFAFRDRERELEDPTLASVMLVGLIGISLLFGIFKLWSDRNLEPSLPPLAERHPRWSGFQAVGSWMLVAALSVGVLWGLDSRGVRLNLIDQQYRLKPEAETASAEERAARESLRNMRRGARRGEVPLVEYKTLRQEVKQKLEPKPSAPAP